MTLQKEPGDSAAAEISVHGYVRGDDLPSSGVNPLEILLGPLWAGQDIVLDFGRVTEMGSAGLGWLLMTHRTLKQKDKRLVVHSVKPLVLQQFKLMSVTRIVTVTDDRAAALAAVVTPVIFASDSKVAPSTAPSASPSKGTL